MSDLGAARRLDGLRQWKARTASVLTAFPYWPAEVRCLDLTEEVGELARAVLVAEGRTSTELEEPVTQALCGVLCNVFALAEQYQVDLDVQYGDQLALLAARRASRGPVA
jgi:NTP pyrophosphatase (non-canonical NTP hydrolase)